MTGKLPKTITMSHGSGGKAMRDLIAQIFVSCFDNDQLRQLEDQASLPLSGLANNDDKLAFTTDSYVVDPLFFPGGDIGKLAISGTVNDLAVGGAQPHYLSCGMIIEEGLPVADLQAIVESMRRTAIEAGVQIVTGDTKVVPRGAADKLFINTAGVGIIASNLNLSSRNARPGDLVIVNGFIGDHEAAIMNARGDMALENTLQSDCQPLTDLISRVLQTCPQIRCMRDATRGGIATVLNEFATASAVNIHIDEASMPLRDQVRGMCEILGLDPLYLANEGKVVAIVPQQHAENVVQCMQSHPDGLQASIIGEIRKSPENRVTMSTRFGGDRIVDMLLGEQLPRIC